MNRKNHLQKLQNNAKFRSRHAIVYANQKRRVQRKKRKWEDPGR